MEILTELVKTIYSLIVVLKTFCSFIINILLFLINIFIFIINVFRKKKIKKIKYLDYDPKYNPLTINNSKKDNVSKNNKDENLEKEMKSLDLEEWQKELVRKGEYNIEDFEEDAECDDDYYYEDEKK